MDPRVTADMNSKSLQPVVEEEVRIALSQMHHFKSRGSDGYTAGFYQKSWSTTGSKVSKAVLHFLNGGPFDEALNSTNIVLIPKVNSPTKVTDDRPISLYNVFYKLIAKVFANRFKNVLPLVIFSEQSTFISERLIIDNILVSFETLIRVKRTIGWSEIF
jgi:hypothetical protein